ncbi:MAG: chorismate synthase [Ruminococcus sp.]|nr:chorismate synthase [Ruminococcus sp.]
MSSFWNNRISISIFGESDGPAIGVTIDDLPSGEYIDTDELTKFMARRNIGIRTEAANAVPHILSGISSGRTTGAPLCAFVQNVPAKPTPKVHTDPTARCGHADYTGAVQYRDFSDFKDRGNFSQKMTIPLCFAGSICAQILERRGIYTGAHIASIHGLKDNPFDPVNITRDGVRSIRIKRFPVINDRRGWAMLEDIRRAEVAGESLGGVVECACVNVPAGVGSPVFNGLENNIAQLIFGIPGVTGLEFGAGFRSASMLGSQSDDRFYLNDRGYLASHTNHHGGILGGISSGMPVTLKVAFSPVGSTGDSGERETCTVPAAVASVEAAVNIALLSQMIDYPNFC